MRGVQREKIVKKVLEILEGKPNGIRYSELLRALRDSLAEVPENTIHGTIYDLNKKIEDIAKPERGVFILTKYLSQERQAEILRKKLSSEVAKEAVKEVKKVTTQVITPDEESFYSSFAEYLEGDLGECTKAIPLGGNKFGDKWGTPDVLGIYKFSETDLLRPPIEIISAEIKTDTNQLITAFGQVCSYKLFSHKVYLVVPKDAERDIGRLESLCSRFGIGLILFDKSNSKNPDFEIRTRATKNEPDYFYVNDYLRKLGEVLKKLF